jgi:mRNA-degrading endonuclease RelE of RelBE toxin-antitoxin system
MITFTPTPVFNKNVKRLAKRYPSFIEDLKVFLKDLEKNPEQGTPIGEFRKIRMAITSKAKGKSGGARVITVNCIPIIYPTANDNKRLQSTTNV